MQDGMLPPQVNLDDCWPGLAGLRRVTQPQSAQVDKVLVVSLAPEGTLSAVALERA